MTTLLTDRNTTTLRRILDPFEPHQVSQGVISYGLSSVGYDIRLANEFRVFTNLHAGVIDPKDFRPGLLTPVNGRVCLIPPNAFALGRSLEHFTMPRDILGLCIGKSTYARCGIIINITPLEPGWEGHLTIEISNTTPLPARVYAHEGIAQVLFFKLDLAPRVSYANRKGKYQHQEGITLPIVRPDAA